MTATANRILEDALSLPDADRRRIAELLLDSVSSETTAEIQAAWVAQAVRRAEELERGEAVALDGKPILDALKAQLQSAKR